MQHNNRIGVLISTAETESALPSQLKRALAGQADLTILETPEWRGESAREHIASLCRQHRFSQIVVCGPSVDSSGLPDWIDTGNGSGGVPVLHAAVREQCAWVEQNAAAAAEKAVRLVEMAIARARLEQPHQLATIEPEQRVAVLGGHHAAFRMTQALVGAGYPVLLLASTPPAGCYYPLSGTLVKEVGALPGVEVLEGATLTHIDGCVGAFQLTATTPSGRSHLTVGAIVVAVDGDTCALSPPAELADVEAVLSLRDFGVAVSQGRMKDETVCIWLDHAGVDLRCAGQAAMQYAMDHERRGGHANVLFTHVPVYGAKGQQVYDDARKAGVRFFRANGTPPRITPTDHGYQITLTDAVLSDRSLALNVDRVVLPSPMRPSATNSELARLLGQPLDTDGYLQPGNVRHRPVGSARRGVFYVGGCHDAADPDEAALEAKAVLAALRATLPQTPVRVPVGKVEIDIGRCMRCLNCMRKCPHGAMHREPDKVLGRMEVLDPACYQCGICTALCPAQALEHSSLRRAQLHAMLQAATRDLLGRAPVIAFACRQSAVPAADGAGRAGLSLPTDVLLLDVPCAGLISDNLILETLVLGARGVLVLGCHHDNCRSLWGSDMARKRIARLHRSLDAIDVERERVQFHTLAANESHRLAHLLERINSELPAGRIGNTPKVD
ncbi:MAG: hydrogenase iron-sulfur subunit [bacterium]